jgi:hypothetical protein
MAGRRIVRAVATASLLLTGCSQPNVELVPRGPPEDQPCAFASADSVAAIIGIQVEARAEPGGPEHGCRFLDPATKTQVAALTVQDHLTDAEADDFLGQAAQGFPSDATLTEVTLDAGAFGSIPGAAYSYVHREAGPTTSLLFGIPPYVFVVHVDGAIGDLDEAVAIGEQALDRLAP